MFNLYQIVTGAQGGQGLDTLAQRFGLSRDQADSAVRALVPALSTAFMAKSAQPGGLGEIAGAMGEDGHRRAYADPAAAQDPGIAQKGGAVAGSIFGNNAMVGQVIAQASRYSGIPAATLEQMLPVVTSMVLGGVASAMHGQGLGGILGQLAGGGMFGPFGGGAGQAGTVPGGSFGGMVGEIFGSLFGGQQAAGASPGGTARANTTQAGTTQAGTTQAGTTQGGTTQGGMAGGAADSGAAPGGAGMPPMMRAGMEALGRMFQSGVPSPGQGNLGDDISSILGGKRG